MKLLNLKVFVNKRNGQTAVHLPKKELLKIPPRVEIRIPKEYIKKEFLNKKGVGWK